ncbi:MAG: hypothetical protein K9N35_03470 [Candidatus Marinimicrobia bacterium]|nr:hypothetical protein [Candidatus Neomarinimicrobiota bacterium]
MNVRYFSLLTLVSMLWGQNIIATIEHEPIGEQSSLVKSKTYDDVYWVSNDSGDDPVIFPLNGKGEIIIPGFLKKHYIEENTDPYPGVDILGAVHSDWETMALLNDTLIIGDVGNNGNARRDLGIYLIPEPNPFDVYATRPLGWYPVRFEDQDKYPPDEWEYDCEAIFTFQGKIYFLTKHRADQHISKPAPATKLYRMDTRHTDRTNVLKLINRKENLGGWVTAADIAPDESAMVMLAQNPLASTIWYFPRPKVGDDFLAEKPKRFNLVKADQAEGICFKDQNTLIVSNEQRQWFEISLKDFSK